MKLAANRDMYESRVILLALCVGFCGGCSVSKSTIVRDYDTTLAICIDEIRGALMPIEAELASGTGIRASAVEIFERLPADLKHGFDESGSDTKRKLERLLRLGVIDSTFSNVQLVSEALWYQYFSFDSVAGCEELDSGVVGEVVEDQLYAAFVSDKSLESLLIAAGLSDLAERRRALLFAIILERTGLEWSEKDLVSVLKYHPKIPE